MISITSLYFHCSIFLITSDFSIHLIHFTSELQTPITFLFVNQNTKTLVWACIFLVRTWQIFWYQNYLGLLKNFVFVFSAPPFPVCETLHVAYKKYKIKREFTFFVNTKYLSSLELKTSEFSLVLPTRENSDVFNTLDEIFLVFTSKKKMSSI